jgi:hypothetical protein
VNVKEWDPHPRLLSQGRGESKGIGRRGVDGGTIAGHPNSREDPMKAMTKALVLATAAMGVSSLVMADGMSDPYKAREVCDQRGEGKSAEALKKCCNNLILVADIKQQRKLEEQCVKGKPKPGKEEGKKK